MPPSDAIDRTGARRPIAEEFAPSNRVGMGAMLLRLASVRRQREAHALAQAQKPLRRTRAGLHQAEQELAENRRRLSASARDWHTGSQLREVSGRDLARAHAALVERSARLAAQVERVAQYARLCRQAQDDLENAMARYAQTSRRQDQLRRWLRDLQADGDR